MIAVLVRAVRARRATRPLDGVADAERAGRRRDDRGDPPHHRRGGAFSQVLRDGGVADYITRQAAGFHVNPLILAFGVAALLRASIGSATVAGMTAAGVLAPTVARSAVHPELMVLATARAA